ncbi:hypothetical protein [Amycolatopsis sp. MtRt-6]|uniref:hypothetical protein n=1 Tax=Amycolatopsis sp. MtRt-6 TaxID=2792782 RepID=UPI001F5DFA19|nr:hypothetical protein [Amycolatopsis sp. MtRt-6]
MAWSGLDRRGRRGVLGCGDEGAGPGKPVTVALLLADEATAEALETDFLRWFGVDLLDLYRNRLTYRRVCTLVTHLPDDAAVWRTLSQDGAWGRTEILLAATERRITAIWALLATALGQAISSEQLDGPLDIPTSSPRTRPSGHAATGEPEPKSLREIATWMRDI